MPTKAEVEKDLDQLEQTYRRGVERSVEVNCVAHDLDAARKHAKSDADAASIAWAQDRINGLEQALRLPLMFHDGCYWTEDRRAEWERITGTSEATTAVMCGHLRRVLSDEEGE